MNTQPPSQAREGSSFPGKLTYLFIAEFFILLANGMAFTDIAVRGIDAGLDSAVVGLAGSAYYAGLFVIYLAAPGAIGRWGLHRTIVHAVLIAILGTAVLPLVLPVAWICGRFLMGIGTGLFFVSLESWLIHAARSPSTRASAMAFYIAIVLAAYAAGQAFLMFYPAGSRAVTPVVGASLVAGLLLLALLRPPEADKTSPFAAKTNWLPPLSTLPFLLVAFASGLAAGAFFATAPVYVLSTGLPAERVPIFLMTAAFGAAVAQSFLGFAAARFDRHYFLAALCGSAAVCAFLLTQEVGTVIFYIAGMAWGGTAMTGYAVAAAAIHDHNGGTGREQTARMTLTVNSFGGIIGPMLSPHFSIGTEANGLFVLTFLVFSVATIILLCFPSSTSRSASKTRSS